MHLYTSNSNTRLPELPHKKIWTGTASFCVILIVIAEIFFRILGHHPSISDTPLFWATKRQEVYHKGQKTIVIVGNSRAQANIVPKVLKQHFPEHHIVHLAIDGTKTWPIVKDLAEDYRFCGTILYACSSLELSNPSSPKTQQYLNTFYQYFTHPSWHLDKKAHAYIHSFLQKYFCFLNSSLSIANIVINRCKTLKPSYHYLLWSRYRPNYYFDHLTAKERRELKNMRIRFAQEQLQHTNKEKKDGFSKETLLRLKDIQEKLKTKKGQLILIRMPTSDATWEWAEEKSPKKKFWDRLTPLTNIPAIHFMDYPELSKFDCPDSSHLDARDAAAFSKNLAQLLSIP